MLSLFLLSSRFFLRKFMAFQLVLTKWKLLNKSGWGKKDLEHVKVAVEGLGLVFYVSRHGPLRDWAFKPFARMINYLSWSASAKTLKSVHYSPVRILHLSRPSIQML